MLLHMTTGEYFAIAQYLYEIRRRNKLIMSVW